MKKYSILFFSLVALSLFVFPFYVHAGEDILADTKTGNDYVQVVYPHYGFTPTASGTLESIELAFSALNPTNPTYDFVVTLEYPNFNLIDCVSDVVVGSSGNFGREDHSIVTTVSGFHGKDCALTAGQSYGLDFGALKAFGAVWGDALKGGGFGIYRGTFEATCTDGIQNQNETGVDTGGVCDTSNALLDDFTDKGFDHEVAPHWQFTPTKSGTLTSIMGYFSNRYRFEEPTGAHLETADGFSLDCNAIEVVDYNSLGLHTIFNGWKNFTGTQCHLEAGVSYGIKLDVTQMGGVWVSDSVGRHPKVFYYGIPDAPTGTCTDGIQNQDETGVDTGGVCGTPPPPTCTENCFSSVLFLPGIKGSILKTGSDTIWPPTIISNDIPELAVTDAGESVNNIYVDGIVNSSYGIDIYGPFSEFMDGLVSYAEINEWVPMAYDWRFMPEKILNDGIKTASGTIDVVAEVERLANESKTGKVTIVAHSMGGLLGKAIIKKLTDIGKDNLIDSFVMVGTPQLGTPQALASVLHADNESKGAGFIVNGIDLRRVAQNMPSVYNLLPSSEYFHEVPDPVFTMDPYSTFIQTWVQKWGPTINYYSNFISFLSGGNGVRTQPLDNELNKPTVLRNDLLTNATNFHNQYDNYQFPEHIRVVQVAGWGSTTIKAVNYKTVHGAIGYDLSFTIEGDQTVVYPSAISSDVDETYYFDQGKYKKNEHITIEHKNLLNSIPIQNILDSVIKDENIVTSNVVTSTKPLPTEVEDQLIVSTHSPVILGAYDQVGNFTGINPNQDLSAEVLKISENIPGSTFIYSTDNQYIFLPKNGTYHFIYQGTGTGPTTTTIENFSADVTTPIVSFVDIPTKLDTQATFDLNSTSPASTEIKVDFNNDGNIDANMAPTPPGISALYPFNGFSQPINDVTYQVGQSTSVFKAGSTVPVKFQLKKSDGTIVQAKSLPIWNAPVSLSSMSASVDEPVVTATATTGTNFKWDATSQQYIYNWSTKGLKSGYWYKLSVKLDDGSTYNVKVGLK
jgi:hypothetical protein